MTETISVTKTCFCPRNPPSQPSTPWLCEANAVCGQFSILTTQRSQRKFFKIWCLAINNVFLDYTSFPIGSFTVKTCAFNIYILPYQEKKFFCTITSVYFYLHNMSALCDISSYISSIWLKNKFCWCQFSLYSRQISVQHRVWHCIAGLHKIIFSIIFFIWSKMFRESAYIFTLWICGKKEQNHITSIKKIHTNYETEN